MVFNKTDPVLTIVGVILAVAIIVWIAAAAIIPSEPIQKTKFTSTGKSVGGATCCDKESQQPTGCGAIKSGGCQGKQSGCLGGSSRNAAPSCQRG